MLQGDIDNGQEQRRRCGKNQENPGAEAFKRADERGVYIWPKNSQVMFKKLMKCEAGPNLLCSLNDEVQPEWATPAAANRLIWFWPGPTVRIRNPSTCNDPMTRDPNPNPKPPPNSN